ncbi:hypothetical protein [Enterococcus sp. DIV1420a]|uniref:hypothetical protein n=1 Tax=Enterococcus TaxID=1350 RepID=UPI003F2639FE
MENEKCYKEIVEQLVLTNQLHYSDIPYELRTQNLTLFYYAIRVARDNLHDAKQFVAIMEQFLLDIDRLELVSGINIRLRRRATDAILGGETMFTGVSVFDEFLRQEKRVRSWLFAD